MTLTMETSCSEDELKERLQRVKARPENQFCCDCSDKNPTWATLIVLSPENAIYQQKGMEKVGAFCCFHCSGAHRSLGTHICFVRSVTLDSWKEKEVIALEQGGNTRVNAFFEAKKLVDEFERPTSNSEMKDRKQFILNKYEKKKFYQHDVEIPPSPSSSPPPVTTSSTTTMKTTRKKPGPLLRQMSMPVMGSPKLDLFRALDPAQLLDASTVLSNDMSPPLQTSSHNSTESSNDPFHVNQEVPKRVDDETVAGGWSIGGTKYAMSSPPTRSSSRSRKNSTTTTTTTTPDENQETSKTVSPNSTSCSSLRSRSSSRSRRSHRQRGQASGRDPKLQSDGSLTEADGSQHSMTSSVRPRSSSRSRRSQRTRRPSAGGGDAQGDGGMASGSEHSSTSCSSRRSTGRHRAGRSSDPKGKRIQKTYSSPDLLSPVQEPSKSVKGTLQSKSENGGEEDKLTSSSSRRRVGRRTEPPSGTATMTGERSSSRSNRRNMMSRQLSVPALSSQSDHVSSTRRNNASSFAAESSFSQLQSSSHSLQCNSSSNTNRRNNMARQGSVPVLMRSNSSSSNSNNRTTSDGSKSIQMMQQQPRLRKASSLEEGDNNNNGDPPGRSRATNNSNVSIRPKNTRPSMMARRQSSVPALLSSSSKSEPPQRGKMMMKSTATVDPRASRSRPRPASNSGKRSMMARQSSVPVLRSGAENGQTREDDSVPIKPKKTQEQEQETTTNPMISFLGSILSPGKNKSTRHAGLASLHMSMPQMDVGDDDIVSEFGAAATNEGHHRGGDDDISIASRLNNGRVLSNEEQDFLRILKQTADSTNLTSTPRLDHLHLLKHTNLSKDDSQSSEPQGADDDDDDDDMPSLASDMPSLASNLTTDTKSIASEMPSLCSATPDPPEPTLYGLPYMPFARDEL